MEQSIIRHLHTLQRYGQFVLALTAMIALAMRVVGIPAARAQISKLMVDSTARVDPAYVDLPRPGEVPHQAHRSKG